MNDEGLTPARPSGPKKRKLASRASSKLEDTLDGDNSTLSEVEGAMAEMDGAMAEMGGAMDAMDGALAEASDCATKDMELMGVDDVEDAFEFDGQKSLPGQQVMQASPWSGFPMLRNETSTLGPCVP